MPYGPDSTLDPASKAWRRGLRWVYLLPLLAVLPWVGNFLYLQGAEYSDLTISHLPNFLYLRRALIGYHTIPLWSPAIFSGYPFYANPLSGLWYPPGWAALLWPEPWAFNLLAAAHLVFGAWGMGRWLESEGLGVEGQALGGLAFGLMPKMIAHFGAGHITLLYAVCWTPWLLYVTRRGPGGWRRPGVVLGLIFFADPRWAAFAAILWLAWVAAHSQRTGRAVAAFKGHWASFALLEGLIAFLLAAPLLLPLAVFSLQSTRALMSPQEVLAFSLPPVGLLNLFLHGLPGTAEWLLYPGAAVLVAALAGAAMPPSKGRSGFWTAVAVGSLLFAMGEAIPLLSLWSRVPGANLLRVPSRALFLFDIALIVLAAHAFDLLVRLRERPLRPYAHVALAAIWLAIAAGSQFLDLPEGIPYAISAVFGLLAAVLFALGGIDTIPRRLLTGLLLLLLALDLGSEAYSLLEPRSKGDVLSEGAAAADWLAAQPGEFRIYSPTYSISQYTAAFYGLDFASGVDPLQWSPYAALLAEAGGYAAQGYSIPLPPPDDEVLPAPDARLLGLLNVRYVVSDLPVTSEDLEEVAAFGQTRIYRNPFSRGPFWVEGSRLDHAPSQPAGFERSPNRFEVAIRGPAVLVLSVPAYPGWRASAGKLLEPAAGVLQRIEVSPDAGRVVLSFLPLDLAAGILLFAAGAWLVTRERRVHGA